MTQIVSARISWLVSFKLIPLSANQLALTSHPVEHVILRGLFLSDVFVKTILQGWPIRRASLISA